MFQNLRPDPLLVEFLKEDLIKKDKYLITIALIVSYCRSGVTTGYALSSSTFRPERKMYSSKVPTTS